MIRGRAEPKDGEGEQMLPGIVTWEENGETLREEQA